MAMFVGRVVPLALAMLATASCGRTQLEEPFTFPVHAGTPTLPVIEQSVNSDVDIVFMIDNSNSMREEQTNLARNFPVFMNALKALPEGLPNIHVGIVSSDLGTSSGGTVLGCSKPGGDKGIFQSAPRARGGACPGLKSGNFIRSVGSQRNFDGDIEQVMACLAELGIGGCGFEQQLGSVRRALGGDEDGVPPENADFLRDEASLAIILLTDEDDCSIPAGSDLHDPEQHLISDPLGPLDSYRCNEFGHLCGGVPPPRTMAAQGLADCRSAEEKGKLVPITEFVTFLQSLKPNPEDVMVAVITGPPTPYDVVLREKTDPVNRRRQLVPEIEPSCRSSNGAAAPAVRLNELVAAFGERGTMHSICADDFSPAMKKIGEEIARRASVQCLEGPVVDVDPAPGLQANCEVFEQTSTGEGVIRSLIPPCEISSPPCWRLRISRDCLASNARMSVDRAGFPAPPQTRTTVLCETCETAGDPRCRF